MDDDEVKRRVEETVLGILEKADLALMTLVELRSLASAQLGIDLSGSEETKIFVQEIVDNFLVSSVVQEEQEQEGGGGRGEEERPALEEEDVREDGEDDDVDENGDIILCQLSHNRRAVLQEFRGKTIISIREYYLKDGKQLPSPKGINLSTKQFATLQEAGPSIEKAIRKRESAKRRRVR